MIDYTLRGKTPLKDNIQDVERQVHVVDGYSAADVTLSLRDVFQQLTMQGEPVSEYQRSFDLAFSFDLDLWRVDATLSRVPITCLENSMDHAQLVLEEKLYSSDLQRKCQLLTQIYGLLQDPTTLGAMRDCYKTEQSPSFALTKRGKGLFNLISLITPRYNDCFLPEIFVDYSSDSLAEIARVREQELRVQQYLQVHLAKACETFSNLSGERRLLSLVTDFESQVNSFVPYSLPESPYFKRKETPEERVQRDDGIRQIIAGRCEDIICELKKGDKVAKMRVDGKMVDYVRQADTPERRFIEVLNRPIVLVKNS